MNKFIEITENGKRILINLGCVIRIEDYRKQCILHFIDGTPPLTINLAYESLKSILQDPNHSMYG
ncbi:hypothetical protein SAMN05444349_15514 [Bacteroides faecichinchillae]|uniref:Uncharacterized protein n=1 Tax=Bacteroides faecichinchillae TaxID=871325 RepID=A0A1M5G4E5_9BACE|nr:hypothetical protein SAMN05444349_15514 [Bacteroides faecichinchillae]